VAEASDTPHMLLFALIAVACAHHARAICAVPLYGVETNSKDGFFEDMGEHTAVNAQEMKHRHAEKAEVKPFISNLETIASLIELHVSSCSFSNARFAHEAHVHAGGATCWRFALWTRATTRV
jgi:hypothetical protein